MLTKLMNSLTVLHSPEQSQTPSLCFPVFSGYPTAPQEAVWWGSWCWGFESGERSPAPPLSSTNPTNALAAKCGARAVPGSTVAVGFFRSQRHCLPSCYSETRGSDYCCEGQGPYRKDRSIVMLGTGLPRGSQSGCQEVW